VRVRQLVRVERRGRDADHRLAEALGHARQHVRIAWIWASYRNEVDFDVVLLPRKGAHVGPMAAGVDMKATGAGAHRRWRVDSFTPRQFYAP